MSQDNDIDFDESGGGIDFRKILNKIWVYKFLIIFSALIGVSIAWVINRYTIPTYLVSSAIIAKGEKESKGADILDASTLFTNEIRSVADEVMIIRSMPLLEKVLYRSEFRISYYQKGRFINSELYKDAPFLVSPVVCASEPQGVFYVIPKNGKGFQLGNENTVEQSQVYKWGDTVQLSNNCTCRIDKRIPGEDTEDEDLGETKRFFFHFNSIESLVKAYSDQLNVSETKNSYTLRLSINSVKPAKDIDFLNFLMEEFILGECKINCVRAIFHRKYNWILSSKMIDN